LSKILKIVAVIASVAAAAVTLGASLGISAALLGAISVGASIGASLLQKRPKAPQVDRTSLDRLNASIDPRTPRKGVFGITAGNTDIRDQEYTDSQTYLHRFIVVAAHKVHEITEIWFDDKKAWTLAGGAQGEYAGYLTVTPILEGTSGNAINISARMGTTRRYTGCAYVYLRYKLTGNSKKTDSPFAQSIPTRFTIRTEGAYVYDPRLDSTVIGGSGAHRADDQSTWTWDDNASRNPALLLLWYLLGWRINGIVSIGCGIPANRIDLESFITAANLCDESVSLAAGGSEPRYRADGVFSDGDDPTNVIDNLKAAMNADLDDVGGKFRLTVFHNDLADPGPTFSDEDMVEGFRWVQTPALSDSFNIVRGSYTDPRDVSLYQLIDAPQVEIDSRDGIDRFDQFDLALVQSPSQWQRLAKQRLQRQQYGGEFTTVFNARGWLLQKNMVIPLTFSRLGWTEKLFRVAEMEHRVDGTCPVMLREENAAIYAWDEEEAPEVTPADPSVYDTTLNPIIQGIDEANSRQEPTATAIMFAGNSAGVLDPSDQLPETLLIQRFEGSDDVSTDAGTVWSILYTEGISGTAPTVADGVLTIPSGCVISPGYALIRVKSVRNSLDLITDVTLGITNAPPSTTGTGGGGAGNVSTFSSVSGTSLIAITAAIPVKTGTGGQIDFSGILATTGAKAAPEGTFAVNAQWRYRELPSGSWTWIGSAIDDTTSLNLFYDAGLDRYIRSTGQIDVADSVTGLTASTDHEVELHAARSDLTDGARDVSFIGTVTVTGS